MATHSNSVGADSRGLGVAYDRWRGETALHALVESDADSNVAYVVAGYGRLDDVERRRIRESLTADDLATLLTFARRRALAVLREPDPALTREGVAALAAIDGARAERHELEAAAALLSYAVAAVEPPGRADASALGRLRGLVARRRARAVCAEAFLHAAARADTIVAEILRRFAREPVSSLRPWGFRRIETRAGPVLFADEGAPREPSPELTELALDLVAVLEADSYQVTSVALTPELPQAWLAGDEQAAAARSRLSGAVALSAELRPSAHPTAASQELLVLLAEAPSPGDASTLVEAAKTAAAHGHETFALADERLLCIAIARSSVEGVPAFERPGALARFGPAFASLLSRGSRAAAR